jgi:hypothetical protein
MEVQLGQEKKAALEPATNPIATSMFLGVSR